MAIVFSYRWNRNPSRLLRSFGLSVRCAQEEARFFSALDDAPDNELGDFCLIMGGFTDGFLGRAYALLGDVKARLGPGFDIYYREHDEHAGARRLLRRYGALRRRAVLIGHSWGASSLARDIVPSCPKVRVDALITLDPVGLRGPAPLPSVRRWLNVYLPYGRAAWSRENNVARLGRPWEYVREASLNRVPSRLRHADALGMFREYGASFLTLALMERDVP
ncbi:alpha/beta fold hydrolase [Mailhella massiliensis]|uniref:Alpha/beta fold hydrolase n=1 Tax=Mailhella massiliensis TaxID=1903261 RepID=A0A921AW09_9BACT|nr:alpha/beta fold hydrolase [Mailhella massiliensis]HJD96940.1 alpha/beta fold hydrolase [Mailhella massiliensis]